MPLSIAAVGFSAQIVDYSLDGMSLEGTLGLSMHDPIQVELILKTRLMSKVAE
jgi:hypothetical protein